MKFIGQLLLSDGFEDEFYIIVNEISLPFSPKSRDDNRSLGLETFAEVLVSDLSARRGSQNFRPMRSSISHN
jgi:hypothetical protein